MGYFQRNFKDILRQCDQHGIEHRLPMNQTPLMAAAAVGNIPLVDALLERSANLENTDHYGWNTVHWALRDPTYAHGPFAAIFERVAPSTLDVNVGERLVRIDRNHSEYLLFQTLWTLFRSRFNTRQRKPFAAFETADILDAWQHLPASVLRPERAKRQHISSVLSRNEAARDYAYNRRLFVRMDLGWYQLNPQISVRRRDKEDAGSGAWTPLCQALNLPLATEFPHIDNLGAAIRLAKTADIAIDPRPLLKRPLIARAEEALHAQEAQERLREEARERIRAEIAARHAAEAGKKGK